MVCAPRGPLAAKNSLKPAQRSSYREFQRTTNELVAVAKSHMPVKQWGRMKYFSKH